ncbi:hypothetical protein KRM28CT15_26210 [Krasilnikovia sp. M28-CT-15]
MSYDFNIVLEALINAGMPLEIKRFRVGLWLEKWRQRDSGEFGEDLVAQGSVEVTGRSAICQKRDREAFRWHDAEARSLANGIAVVPKK